MHFCEKRLVFIKKNSCLYLVQYSQKKISVFIWYNILKKVSCFYLVQYSHKNSCLYLVQYSQKKFLSLFGTIFSKKSLCPENISFISLMMIVQNMLKSTWNMKLSYAMSSKQTDIP